MLLCQVVETPLDSGEEAKKLVLKAVEMNVTRDIAKCEEYMEEALRMIRKTGGEYPTE